MTPVQQSMVDAPQPASWTWNNRLRQPGWVLLPLRLFLGFTFTYAGLDKLSDPHFFQPATDPLSLAAQMQNFRQTSPIGALVGLAADHPLAVGILISLAEIAVGLGTLAGLFSRLAAVGGALLSLNFLLTVSWHTRPFYYGSDVGFLMSWLPLILVGSGGVLSLDAWLAKRSPPEEAVLSRRSFMEYGAASLVLAAVGLSAVWAAVASRDRLTASRAPGAAGPAPGPAAGATKAPGAADALVATNKVPVGGAVLVTDKKTGEQVHVLQPTAGTFECLSAICTHTGCTVAWQSNLFNCPCHGSQFDEHGKVLNGPAARPLPVIPVRVEGDSVVRT
ncbi:MAG: Rieske 2Fe-2S domain-containing protein [Mycobacteriales bacterium]